MNKQMVGGVIRHFLTVVAGGIVVGNTDNLHDLLTTLMTNIASGDVASIVGTGIIVLSVLWSIWVKASEDTKENVIKTLTFQKKG